jgi:hypothetical protein
VRLSLRSRPPRRRSRVYANCTRRRYDASRPQKIDAAGAVSEEGRMGLRDDLARMEAEDKAATEAPWVDDKREGGCVVAPHAAHPYVALQVNERADAIAIASARTDRPALREMVRSLTDMLRQHVAMAHPEAWDNAVSEIERRWAEAKRKAGVR